MTRDAPVPVLVFGSGITVLGLVRVLGKRGIPAYVVTDAPGSTRWSRWYRAAPRLPVPGSAVGPRELEAYLEGLPYARAVVMPATDRWARLLAGLGGPLSERFPSSLPSPDVLDRLVDKGRLGALLDRLEVAHPFTSPVEGPEDLERVPAEAFTSAFLKPVDSQSFFARFGVKAFWVRSRGEAAERLRAARAAGERVVFQEYVPGGPAAHVLVDGFVDRGGHLVAAFVRRRERMYPLDFGNSTFMRSVARGPEVEPAVEAAGRLLGGIGFRGVFNAEFKRDRRDGVFRLLEVNARPWWYVEFAARCGVDVVWLAYRDALGLPVESPPRYAVGKRLVYPYYDWFACRALVRRGELSVGRWVRDWVGAWQPVFEWSDPLPAWRELWGMAAGFLRRR